MRLLVAVSIGFYLATSVGGVALPPDQNGQFWFFNPLAWQLAFVTGVVLGLRQRQGQTVAYHSGIYFAAVVFLAGAAVWTTGHYGGAIAPGVLPEWLGSLHKSNLPMPRLLHLLALCYVVGHSPVWRWLELVPANFTLTQMGRCSLPVFMAGSLLSMAGWIVLTEVQSGQLAGALPIASWVDTAIAAIGLALMMGLARWLDRPTKPKVASQSTAPNMSGDYPMAASHA